ncbi:MAG: portal protein [Anaerolineales bacterium]
MADTKSLKARFAKLHPHREQFLQRARHNALLTIPSLVPLAGHDGRAHLIEPYQGLGSAGVVHLSSRLTMSLLPAGRPHLRLDLPPRIVMENGGEIPKEIEKGLALSEQIIQGEVEDKGWRPVTLQSIQQLLVAGSVIEHHLPDNTIRIFRLEQFVVRRDYAGRVLEAIIEEKLTPDTLPPGVEAKSQDEDEPVFLYTSIKRKPNGVYTVSQEVDGAAVGKAIEFISNDLPYRFLRWSATPGEDYGRSFVEEHIADLRSLDSLEKAMLEMAAMASRNFIAVRPGAGGTGIRRRITQAVNGDVVMVDPESLELKSFDNTGGYQITQAQVQSLRESLAKAFLLLSAGQRDAERVTAVEIERDIQELEAALGGNFSNLNAEMMEPRTRLLMSIMEANGELPEAITSSTRPTILTGLEALSRERDVGRAVQLMQIAGAAGDAGFDAVKMDKLLARVAIGLGFPDVVRTDEEIQQRQAQRQQAELAQAIAGPAAGAIAKGATEGPA